jgi:hypothetical protein
MSSHSKLPVDFIAGIDYTAVFSPRRWFFSFFKTVGRLAVLLTGPPMNCTVDLRPEPQIFGSSQRGIVLWRRILRCRNAYCYNRLCV